MSKTRFYSVLLSCLFLSLLLMACPPPGGTSVEDEESTQAQLPQIKVNLPPPPTFQKEHAPETYADGTYSIYGLRKNMRANINKQFKVRAFLIEVYQCPECPKGQECPPCNRPHFWLSDRANGSKDKGLLVSGYPKKDPKTKKKLTFVTGVAYYVIGVFAKSSGTGFSASDGLLIYADSTPVLAD